jgi:UDP-N-acetylmuramate--alanine ligase
MKEKKQLSIEDIGGLKHLHFVGIGGVGMSPIATIFLEKGFNVSGSDVKENINTFKLKDKGAKISFKHDASNIRGAIDLIVISTAISENNVELIAAKEKNIPIMKRAQLLAWLMSQEKHRIAVAGTHGKTTTSSMASLLFLNCKKNPTFLIGGEINTISSSCDLGKGEYFIAEADESDGSLLELSPNIEIITNIDVEHMDFYSNLEHIIETFEAFTKKIPKDGFLIMNTDQENTRTLLEKVKCRVVTYGLSEFSDVRADNVEYYKNNSSFDVIYKHKHITRIELQVPGEHNVNNALAALSLGLELDLPIEPMRQALYAFTGTKKRFQLVDELNNISLYDDYAHHPTEIEATISATKNGWPDRRVIVIFQPHRYSRTKCLADTFKTCFDKADMVIITSIFAASEDPIPGVTGELVVNSIIETGFKKVHYIERKDEIPIFLTSKLKKDDIVITMGAGDIHRVTKEISTRLKNQKL